jgi:RNA ligase (TIGR02306 family)
MPPASIQKCLALTPIEGADRIEVAKVLGWDIVVKKGDFKVGDLGVFIEIDSVVPPKPEFEFLRQRHFVVKTIKLRKQLSQGLFMPLSILSNAPSLDLGSVVENLDVSEALEIIHYEKDIPAQLRATIRGNFPRQYLPKTDEERIQSNKGLLQEIVGKCVYATVKMDGCSSTFIHCNGDTHVCSRNNSLQEDENNSFWKMEKKYNILEKLKAKGNFAIQGELCGPGIQGNKIGLKELDLFVFNVYDIDNKQYLSFHAMQAFIKELGLTPVPIAQIGRLAWTQAPTIDELLELAKGSYENGHPREGIVIRTVEEQESRALKGRFSFKVVNNEFLLHTNE